MLYQNTTTEYVLLADIGLSVVDGGITRIDDRRDARSRDLAHALLSGVLRAIPTMPTMQQLTRTESDLLREYWGRLYGQELAAELAAVDAFHAPLKRKKKASPKPPQGPPEQDGPWDVLDRWNDI